MTIGMEIDRYVYFSQMEGVFLSGISDFDRIVMELAMNYFRTVVLRK